MADPEGNHAEPDRPLGVSHRNHHGTEPTRRPRHVRLDAAAEARTVSSLWFTAKESTSGQAAKPHEFSAEQCERLRPSLGESGEVLGHGQLIEGNREDWPLVVESAQPSPSRDRSPKCASNSSSLSCRSP